MEISNSHLNNIKALKSAILQSRYRAASLVNKELLTLYFAVGKFISHKIEEEKWGSKIIERMKHNFLDLLFFNRRLQCLVVFKLKTGKFKPEYIGKMNFYLSALDEYVKQPHEQPSIGVILCKEKKNKVVEFSFRDFNKAMGVATYRTSTELPAAYKGVLPDVETLKKLMD